MKTELLRYHPWDHQQVDCPGPCRPRPCLHSHRRLLRLQHLHPPDPSTYKHHTPIRAPSRMSRSTSAAINNSNIPDMALLLHLHHLHHMHPCHQSRRVILECPRVLHHCQHLWRNLYRAIHSTRRQSQVRILGMERMVRIIMATTTHPCH